MDHLKEYTPMPWGLPDQGDEPPEEEDEHQGQEDVAEVHCDCDDLSNINTATC